MTASTKAFIQSFFITALKHSDSAVEVILTEVEVLWTSVDHDNVIHVGLRPTHVGSLRSSFVVPEVNSAA